MNDIENKKLTIFRRDLNKKEIIYNKNLVKYIRKSSVEIDKNLTKEANTLFDSKIKDAKNKEEIEKVIETGAIARVNFCSIDKKGIKCVEIIKKY